MDLSAEGPRQRHTAANRDRPPTSRTDPRGRRPGSGGHTKIDAWLLEATLLAAADGWHRARNAVSKALALAEPLSALRPFPHAGPAVRDLLVKGTGPLTGRAQDLLIELPSMRATEEIAESAVRLGQHSQDAPARRLPETGRRSPA
jgi:hypothetical protein